jgi:hypothetical protein
MLPTIRDIPPTRPTRFFNPTESEDAVDVASSSFVLFGSMLRGSTFDDDNLPVNEHKRSLDGF